MYLSLLSSVGCETVATGAISKQDSLLLSCAFCADKASECTCQVLLKETLGFAQLRGRTEQAQVWILKSEVLVGSAMSQPQNIKHLTFPSSRFLISEVEITMIHLMIANS